MLQLCCILQVSIRWVTSLFGLHVHSRSQFTGGNFGYKSKVSCQLKRLRENPSQNVKLVGSCDAVALQREAHCVAVVSRSDHVEYATSGGRRVLRFQDTSCHYAALA